MNLTGKWENVAFNASAILFGAVPETGDDTSSVCRANGVLRGLILAVLLVCPFHYGHAETQGIIRDDSALSHGYDVDYPKENAVSQLPPTSTPSPSSVAAQPTLTPPPTGNGVIRNYIFGHSLILHEAVGDQPFTYELAVPHWLNLLASASGNSYRAEGQYGIMQQHANNLPPNAQWNIPGATGIWRRSFANTDFTTVLMTPANFVQWQGPNVTYWNGDGSPVSKTLEVIDFVTDAEPGIEIVIYQSWADMTPALKGAWPPTAQQFANYHAKALGDYANWWNQYLSSLQTARPDVSIRMIPVGNIMSRVMTETALSAMTANDWFEDDSPHGRPNAYFLSGLITYMGLYGERAPENFNMPNTIHPTFRQNYPSVVDFIWNQLTQGASSASSTPTPVPTP